MEGEAAKVLLSMLRSVPPIVSPMASRPFFLLPSVSFQRLTLECGNPPSLTPPFCKLVIQTYRPKLRENSWSLLSNSSKEGTSLWDLHTFFVKTGNFHTLLCKTQLELVSSSSARVFTQQDTPEKKVHDTKMAAQLLTEH